MYSINDLADILGLSTDQVRNRLDILGPRLDQHIKRGARNKILIKDGGLALLKRVRELEREDNVLRDIPRILDEELSNNHKNRDSTLDEGLLIKEKDKRIRHLENQVSYLQKKLDEKDQQIQQLLPGSTNGKGIIRRVWARIW